MRLFLTPFYFCTILSVMFFSCSDTQDVSGVSSQNTLLKPCIIWDSEDSEALPDSVNTIDIRISSDALDYDITKSFDYSEHRGVIGEIPKNINITITIQGLDNNGTIIFSGTKETSTGSESICEVTINASEVTPPPPSGLTLEAYSASSVILNWEDNSSNESGFIIERRNDNDTVYTPVDTLISGLTEAANSSLSANTIYYFRIRAYNNAGVSAPLTEQGIKTLGMAVTVDTTAPAFSLRDFSETVAAEVITFSGTTWDASGIDKIIVNSDSTVSYSSDSSFSTQIALTEGENTIDLTIVDASSQANRIDTTFTVTYNPAAQDNEPPVITFSQDYDSITIAEMSKTLSGTVSDAISSVDSFSVSTGSSIALDGSSWNSTVSFSQTGWHDLTFYAEDTKGNSADTTISINIDTTTEDNTPPVISFGSLENGRIFTSSSITLSVNVEDDLSSVSSVTIAENTANQSGSTWSADISLSLDSNTISVQATDAAGNSAEESITLIHNKPPLFTSTPSEMKSTAVVNETYRDTLVVDDDGVLSFSKKTGPTDMTIGIENGIISWTPSSSGNVTCNVTVADKYGYKDTIEWQISVSNPETGDDTPPVISLSNLNNGQSVSSSTILIQVTASDAQSGVEWVTINGQNANYQNGKYERSVYLQSGANIFPVVAQDSSGNRDTLDVTLVYELPAYRVTYKGNGNTGGSVPYDSKSYNENEEVTVLGNTEGLVKTDSVFVKWNTEPDASGTSYGEGDTFVMGGSDVVLYAVWEYAWELINSSNSGLLNDTINDILIDSEGNKWFGGKNGISKFDGNSWTTFSNDEGLYPSEIFCLEEEQNGDIWAGTFEGLFLYTNDVWEAIYNQGGNQIFDIEFDNNNNMWIATNAPGVYEWDRDTWTKYDTSNGLSASFVNEIEIDKVNNIIWIAYYHTEEAGVSKFYGNNWTNYTTSDGLSNNMVHEIKTGHQGRIWAGNEGFLNMYQYSTDKWTEAGPPQINSFSIDTAGNLWCVDHNLHLFKVNSSGEEIYEIPNFINNTWNCSIVVDDSNRKWITTGFEGIVVYSGE